MNKRKTDEEMLKKVNEAMKLADVRQKVPDTYMGDQPLDILNDLEFLETKQEVKNKARAQQRSCFKRNSNVKIASEKSGLRVGDHTDTNDDSDEYSPDQDDNS